MKKIIFCFYIILIVTPVGFAQPGFKAKQQSFTRVKTAYDEKYEGLKKQLEVLDLDIDSIELYLRAYKLDKKLEVWVKNRGDSEFVQAFSYKICRLSGKVGPKRQQGDLQVPEGFYHINIYNPWSNFYLSMGTNYPNKSDRILGKKGNLGGDIYIHGSCVTIGCIPITDECIKELYVLCVEAKNNGQEHIPITIFPCKITREVLKDLVKRHRPDEKTEKLWESLLEAEVLFNEKRTLPTVTFLEDGTHLLK